MALFYYLQLFIANILRNTIDFCILVLYNLAKLYSFFISFLVDFIVFSIDYHIVNKDNFSNLGSFISHSC